MDNQDESMLQVRDNLRDRSGYNRPLTHTEDEACPRGAKNFCRDTFSLQVPGLYQRHDYQVVGERKDFPTITSSVFQPKNY
jgi:hypothetical protein